MIGCEGMAGKMGTQEMMAEGEEGTSWGTAVGEGAGHGGEELQEENKDSWLERRTSLFYNTFMCKTFILILNIITCSPSSTTFEKVRIVRCAKDSPAR